MTIAGRAEDLNLAAVAPVRAEIDEEAFAVEGSEGSRERPGSIAFGHAFEAEESVRPGGAFGSIRDPCLGATAELIIGDDDPVEPWIGLEIGILEVVESPS